MSESSEKSDIDRRTVLKGSVGAAGVVGISKGVSASTGQSIDDRRVELRARKEVPDRYTDEEIRAEFIEVAQPLLEALAERNVIPSASLDGFFAPDVGAHAQTDEGSVIAVKGRVSAQSGQQVSILETVAKTDRYGIGIAAYPHLGTAVARAVPRAETLDEVKLQASEGRVTDLNGVSAAGSCTGDVCQHNCNSPLGTHVMRDQGDGCGDGQCYDGDPSCDECSGQDKCDDDGGGGILW